MIYRSVRFVLILFLTAGFFYASTVLYAVQRMTGNAVFPIECAMVFGAAVKPVFSADGSVKSITAGPGIYRRVATAVELLRQGRVQRLFLSGGKGEGNRKSEAQVMREVAMQLGAKGDSLTIEDQSRSTWENLKNTRPLTSGCKSIVGISDGYHLARIGVYAQMQGWQIQTYPADIQPDKVFTLRSLLREAIGIDLLVLVRLLT